MVSGTIPARRRTRPRRSQENRRRRWIPRWGVLHRSRSSPVARAVDLVSVFELHMSISPYSGHPTSLWLAPSIQIAGHKPWPCGRFARTSMRPNWNSCNPRDFMRARYPPPFRATMTKLPSSVYELSKSGVVLQFLVAPATGAQLMDSVGCVDPRPVKFVGPHQRHARWGLLGSCGVSYPPLMSMTSCVVIQNGAIARSSPGGTRWLLTNPRRTPRRFLGRRRR